MSEHWDLYCATCKVKGDVVHWNRGMTALAKVLPHLRAIAALQPLRAALCAEHIRLMVEFESGPDWQSGLIDFAVQHAAHEVLVRSEYGWCHVCAIADDAEYEATGTFTRTRSELCSHAP